MNVIKDIIKTNKTKKQLY